MKLRTTNLSAAASISVAIVLAIVIGVGALHAPRQALADGTVPWTGQGTLGGVLNTPECTSDTPASGYLHWVFTATGATSATITINGVTYQWTKMAAAAFPTTAVGTTLAR